MIDAELMKRFFLHRGKGKKKKNLLLSPCSMPDTVFQAQAYLIFFLSKNIEYVYHSCSLDK
jgi:hypothetical protein